MVQLLFTIQSPTTSGSPGISRTVNKKSVTQIIGLYRNNKDAFDVLAEKATMIEGISDYPIMRVMDACLWQYGYDWIEK